MKVICLLLILNCLSSTLGCRDSDVQIVTRFATASPGEGRVEFCHNGEWGTVCDDIWDEDDARVVCRQLAGFTSEGAIAVRFGSLGQGTGPIWLDEVRCVGTESRLADCPANSIGVHDCGHSEDAGVRCMSGCDAGDIRLVGDIPGEGRVELCYNNDWGTVCDDSWDDDDASVVCRQLEFSSPERAVAVTRARFGEGPGPIFLDEVRCAGTESRLVDCPSNSIGHEDCSHSEDAGVICTPANLGCSYGDIRLVGGDTPEEGRVEFCYNNDWGTVCDNSWGISDATVVCRQLGFSFEGARAFSQARFGQGTGHILLDEVGCVGTERRLANCFASGIGIHDCSHSEDAGVRCQPAADSASVSTGAIVGIVIGVLVVVFICIPGVVVWWVRKSHKRNRRAEVTPRRTVVTTATPTVAPPPVAYSAQPQQAPAEHPANNPHEEFTASDSELRTAPPPSYEAAIAYPPPAYLPPSFGEGENPPAQGAPYPAQGAPYPAQVPTPSSQPPAPYPSQTSAPSQSSAPYPTQPSAPPQLSAPSQPPAYPADGQFQGPANPLSGVQSAAYPPTAGQDWTYPPTSTESTAPSAPPL